MTVGYVPSIGERDQDKIIRSIRNLHEFGFDFSTLTAETSLASDDTFPFHDTSAAQNRKVTLTNLRASVSTETARTFNVLTPHENLIVKRVSATQVDIDADAVVLFNSDGRPKRFASLNETLAITSSGANGLDTGSEGSSRWYHIWGIGKDDDTLDGLLSESATAPTLPSGYTYKGLLGAVYNDGSSNFVSFLQRGNSVSTARGFTTNQVLVTGTATTYTAIDLSAAVPPTATAVDLEASITTSTNNGFMAISSDGATTTPTYDEFDFSSTAAVTGTISSKLPGFNMVTAQQIEYYKSGTNVSGNIIVVGWRY